MDNIIRLKIYKTLFYRYENSIITDGKKKCVFNIYVGSTIVHHTPKTALILLEKSFSVKFTHDNSINDGSIINIYHLNEEDYFFFECKLSMNKNEVTIFHFKNARGEKITTDNMSDKFELVLPTAY